MTDDCEDLQARADMLHREASLGPGALLGHRYTVGN
jgi:hypothetical protein